MRHRTEAGPQCVLCRTVVYLGLTVSAVAVTVAALARVPAVPVSTLLMEPPLEQRFSAGLQHPPPR